jgi:hypothetical protein
MGNQERAAGVQAQQNSKNAAITLQSNNFVRAGARANWWLIASSIPINSEAAQLTRQNRLFVKDSSGFSASPYCRGGHERTNLKIARILIALGQLRNTSETRLEPV